MPFNSGTGITDMVTMLDKLIEVVVDSRHLASVAINAGGTGHAIGDVIEITATGSTSTILAQLEVTSVAAGVIDGIRVYRSGAYTVDPTTIVANPQSGTSGAGISATFDLTFAAAKWVQNRRTQEAASAVVGTAGNGYNIGDILTLVDGVAGVRGDVDGTGTVGDAATFTVATLTGGAGTGVATVTVTTVGNYEETPTNDAATTNDGGGDDACALTVTWQDGTFANNEFQVCQLEGEGLAGADEIHVGIKTFSIVNGFDTAYNWMLLGMTGYSATLPIHQQPGTHSDEINTSDGGWPITTTNGSYVILKNDDADPDMEWWISWNGRRIIMIMKVEGSSTTLYSSMYLGFLNQFGTDSEYPYPLWTCGHWYIHNTIWTDSTKIIGGIVEVCTNLGGNSKPKGPGYLRMPDGTYIGFASTVTGSTGTTRTTSNNCIIYPFGTPPVQASPALASTGGSFEWQISNAPIPPTGVPGTPLGLLKPTPGTGDDWYMLIAPTLMFTDDTWPTNHKMLGEIDGVFWFHTGGNTIVSEDRFVQGTKRYTIFANGNRTQVWSYFALDED
tara:strand:- start:2181 stop:3857 length:1677 start_codon:yes stop_codon:yes gene_type:complete